MSDNRFIFTVTNGRSGQATLKRIFTEYVRNSYVTFEEPHVNHIFPGFLGDLERIFRRRFIETHELLGRGKVLTSYENNKLDYIRSIAKSRLSDIEQKMLIKNSNTYIDVSKYFARGLHTGYLSLLKDVSVINLVRDPISNMKSFINRNKNFLLDNNYPDSKTNILILDSKKLSKEEFYLWSWCEMYLRFENIKEESNVSHAVEIRTEFLNNSEYIMNSLDELELDYDHIDIISTRLNTNKQKGLPVTSVLKDDIEIFLRFIEKIPVSILKKIHYFDNYDPYKIYQC